MRADGSLVVQTKLEVGSSDDPLEREADMVARQVVATLRNPVAEPGDTGGPTAEAEILRGELARILYERTASNSPDGYAWL